VAGTLLAARTALANAQARKAETEQAVRAGQLVERTRYAKALADAMGPIFASMASISSTRGPDLAAETDVRKVQIMLDDAMDALRLDIAATLQKLIDGPANRQ
jgi:phage terminase Nu1 subunit (DNA packaging protein)